MGTVGHVPGTAGGQARKVSGAARMSGPPILGTTMSRFKPDCIVRVRAFTRQQDASEIVIGLPADGVFLALSPDAVELLDLLVSGKTVGDAADLYTAKYSEVPDLESLLGYLEEKGFVQGANEEALGLQPFSESPLKALRYHFVGFPENLARALFSKFS